MTPTTYIQRVCATLPRTGSRPERVARAAFLSIDKTAVRGDWERHAVLERLLAPECCGSFSVPWTDDRGQVRVDRGFFASYGTLPGFGRLCFQKGLTADEIRCRAFLAMLTGCLTGAHAGMICGVDRDMSALSDAESMRLCARFAEELRRWGPDTPLCLDGAAAREQGYLEARLGAPLSAGLSPALAAGYGLCFFADEALGTCRFHRQVAVLGQGETALAAAEMLLREGGRLTGADEAELVFLCNDEQPLDAAGAERLLARGVRGVFEGVPLACAPEAARRLVRAGVLYAPAIAAGAGGQLSPDARSPWEAEGELRREMRAIYRAVRHPDGLCVGAYTAAVRAAARRLIRSGV